MTMLMTSLTTRPRTLTNLSAALLTIVVCMITLPVKAEPVGSTALTHSDSVETLGSGRYRIVGPDPFFELALSTEPRLEQPIDTNTQNISLDQSDRILLINLTAEGQQLPEKLPLEVFFRANLGPQGNIYDPLHHLSFSVMTADLNAKSGRLAVQLPKQVRLDGLPSIRLDINACNACSVKIEEMPRVRENNLNTEELDKLAVVTVEHFQVGANALGTEGLLLDIADWQVNDIERTEMKLRISGDDPYFESPPLYLATTNLGGLLIKITPPADLKSVDYQLFYATNTHAFIEAASNLTRVPVANSNTDFIIPLHHLSKDTQGINLLEGLRLDIDSASEGDWTIEKIQILTLAQMDQHRALVPNRLLQRKPERAPAWQILTNSLRKISSDLGFSLTYGLLLLLTGFGFVRAFRK